MALAQRIKQALTRHSDEGTAAQLKMLDGNSWAVAWSNDFKDRSGETLSREALDDYVARTEKGEAALPALWVWHMPTLKIGQADFVARDGHFMLAGGTFDKTPRAQKAKAYYAEHLSEIGASHGYTYMTSDLIDKTYRKIQSVKEISLLPRKSAANLGTALLGVKGALADGKKRAHLVAMFGEAEADRILAELADVGKAMEAVGYEHKAKEAISTEDFWDVEKAFTGKSAQKQAQSHGGNHVKINIVNLADAPTGNSSKPAPINPDPFGVIAGTQRVAAAKAKKTRDADFLAQTKAALGYTRHGFWRTELPPAAPSVQQVKARHPFFGTLETTVASSKQMGMVELQDAIDAMQRALKMPQEVVDQMVRQDGQQRTYDILKATIESNGGTVQFNLQVKR